MQVIPVMDLKGGRAVRALGGERDRYLPLSSPLCADSDPLAVASSLLDYCDSELLYVADLDALSGEASQTEVLEALLASQPKARMWLDAGFADADAWWRLAARLGETARRIDPVFASEALRSAAAARQALAQVGAGLLSLDRRARVLPDRAGCWSTPDLWPARLIVMTLDRVGGGGGPDLATLASVRAQREDVTVIGAGGIRNADDLARAAEAGASAWLVASAIHDRRIPPHSGSPVFR